MSEIIPALTISQPFPDLSGPHTTRPEWVAEERLRPAVDRRPGKLRRPLLPIPEYRAGAAAPNPRRSIDDDANYQD